MLFPDTPPLQGFLTSQSACSPSSATLPWGVTLTFEPTSCSSGRCDSNKQLHSQHTANPTPGITWNSRCSPCPQGAKGPPSAHGAPSPSTAKSRPPSVLAQVSRVCICVTPRGPCQLGPPSGPSHFQNSISRAVPGLLSVRIRKTPHRCQAHPRIPESQKPNCQGLPFFCQNCSFKSTNRRVYG